MQRLIIAHINFGDPRLIRSLLCLSSLIFVQPDFGRLQLFPEMVVSVEDITNPNVEMSCLAFEVAFEIIGMFPEMIDLGPRVVQ